MKTLLPAHKQYIFKEAEKIFAKQIDQFDLSVINTSPDRVSSELLAHLTAAFNIENLTDDEQITRKLLKNAFAIKKGTALSLKTAIESFYSKVKVREWFEYGGEPYHFKVELSVDDEIDSEFYNTLEKIIDTYKNTRSVLEKIELAVRADLKSAYALKTKDAEVIKVFPHQPTSQYTNIHEHFAVAIKQLELLKIELRTDE